MSLRISSVGDIMLGENLHHYRRGVASRYLGRFPVLLAPEVAEVINKSDLFFGNFECSLLSDAEWAKAGLERAMYVAPESALSFFKEWKPEVILNIANNHFGQHGRVAAEDTIECLENRGIRCIGRNRNPLTLQHGEWRVVAWGVTLVKDKYSDTGYFKSTADALMDDLGWIEKKIGDYWVVSVHWGEEYHTKHSTLQAEMASKLVARGVDLILGHHPHVVQPVEQTGSSWTLFSHGNFIFDQNFSKLTQTGLLSCVDLVNSSCSLYLLGMKAYRVESLKMVTLSGLDAWCCRRFSRFAPVRMRVRMKLELFARFWEVPTAVWKWFLMRLLMKVCTK